jgi:hypothetical protein
LRALGERTSVRLIGEVGGEALVAGEQIDVPLAELSEAHGALAELFA